MELKVVLFGLACLAANTVMVSSDCTVVEGKNGFDWPSISGRWFIKKANEIVFKQFKHIIFNFEVNKEEVKATGTLREGRSTSAFSGGWKISEHQSSTLVAGFSEVLELFNGTYTTVSADTTCYFFTQGCPNSVDEEVLVIYFRDEHPTEECFQKAESAYEEAGFNGNLLLEDDTFK